MKNHATQRAPLPNIETSISAVLLRGVCRTRMCTPLVAPMKSLKKKV